MKIRRVLLFAVMLLLCVQTMGRSAWANAVRREGTISGVVGDVLVRVSSPWPASLNKGYQPVFLDLENQSGRAKRVKVEGLDMAFDKRFELLTEVLVEPGERRSLELFAPAFSQLYTRYSIEVEVDLERQSLGTIGASNATWASNPVLLLTRGPLEPGAAERWGAQLQERTNAAREALRAEESSQDAGAQAPPGELLLLPTDQQGVIIHGAPPGVRRTAELFARTAPPTAPLGATTYDLAPLRYEAYTSLDAVVIDSAQGLPEGPLLDALFAWARLGGTLAFFGPRARDVLADCEQARPWLEERFRFETIGGVECHAIGWGKLLVGGERSFLESEDQYEALVTSFGWAGGMVPRPEGGVRLDAYGVGVPGIDDLPYTWLILLLFAFGVLIGPLNFAFVKRLGRPPLLLLTIPAVALFASFALVVYGLLRNGLDVKEASRTFAVLDQRESRVSSAQVRELYAGITPGEGLLPGTGTALFPEYPLPNRRSTSVFRIAFEPGTVLSGGYMPTRRAATQVVLGDRSSRLRLDVRETQDGLRVQNGLGVDVEALVLRDASGAFHRLSGPLPAGGEAALQPVVSFDRAPGDEAAWPTEVLAASDLPDAPVEELDWSSWDQLLQRTPPHGQLCASGTIPPGTYLAASRRSPFTDPCGLELVALPGKNLTLGILEGAR